MVAKLKPLFGWVLFLAGGSWIEPCRLWVSLFPLFRYSRKTVKTHIKKWTNGKSIGPTVIAFPIDRLLEIVLSQKVVPKIWLTYIKLARATKKLARANFLHVSQIGGTTSNISSSRYFKGAVPVGSFPISVVQQFSKNGKDPHRKVDKQKVDRSHSHSLFRSTDY